MHNKKIVDSLQSYNLCILELNVAKKTCVANSSNHQVPMMSMQY